MTIQTKSRWRRGLAVVMMGTMPQVVVDCNAAWTDFSRGLFSGAGAAAGAAIIDASVDDDDDGDDIDVFRVME